jgi:ABC-type Na+ efflux pump permease subunit
VTRKGSSAAGFSTTLAFETRKFSRRIIPVVAAVTIVLVSYGAAWVNTRSDDGPRSWALLVKILGLTMPLAAFFLLIMGSMSVNEEITSRAMRAVLIRPVRRWHIIGSKIVVLCATTLILAALAWLSAADAVRRFDGFRDVVLDLSDVGLESQTKFDNAKMTAFARGVLWATIAPLLAASLFSVFVSVIVESAGTAVSTVVFLFFGAYFLVAPSGPLETVAPYLFPTYLDRPLLLLLDAAHAVETDVLELESLSIVSKAVFLPLLQGVLFAATGLVVFLRKEIRC